MKPKHIIGIVVVVGALAYLIFGGLGRNLVYFYTPSECLQNQATCQSRQVRLGGLVKAGTVSYDKDTLDLRFVVTDGVSEFPVQAKGTPPALFGENRGVVVEGRFQGGTFVSTNLLVKHSEGYQAPKEGYTPEQIRKLIEEAK
ncbi:cytochrome c maturation protein CcmE [Calidithermus timidus]|uniref:cytochrome c maturation protein CcmE n=1 Tax=Calidithermus timidus TaxID=307124 RepID=UPI0003705F2D|nr:cytochrome c maturation protein CcmE [Calidithermus timidus]